MKFRDSTSLAAIKIALGAASMFGVASPALAQSAGAPATSADAIAEAAESIVVLGTRRTDRSITDSASPVDVIGAEELASQPAGDMLDVLRNIVPSFNVGQNTIADASTFVRAPSIRGLPGDMTLVMINGKRLNRSALVQVAPSDTNALSQGADLSVLPSIAFGNLQILREGATAQYGSDAIAGVINYTLREDEGFELTGRYGQFYDGGGDGKSRQIAGYAGFNIGERGFIGVAGEWNKDDGTIRNETRPSAVIFADTYPDLADQLPNYPGPVQIYGNSPAKGWKATFNAHYDITDTSQIYAFGNFAHERKVQSFNYRPPYTFPAETTTGEIRNQSRNSSFGHPIYLTSCPTGNATCPSGGYVLDDNTFSFTDLYPAGFTPMFVGVKDQAYGVVGWKGDLSDDFTFNISASTAKNQLELSMFNSLNASYGPDSQTDFYFGKLIQEEFDYNADFTYALDAGLASPITIAFGAEYRREVYTATEGDEQSYGLGPYTSQDLYVETAPGVFAYDSTVSMSPGASGYGGTSPDAAGSYSQNAYAGYLSVEADVTDALTLGAAGRYEHYNTFGSATVGKINALWRVTPSLSVRGTVGTGFHAPSPGQDNVQILTTSFTNGLQVQTGTYPTSSAISQYFGATPLKPEKSTNYGLGFVFTPVSGFTLTVDGYIIELRDRIGVSQTYSVTADDIALQPALLAVGEGGDVQYPTSGYDSRTSGVDVVGTYKTGLGAGLLNLTLAYNYNKTKVTDYDTDVIGENQKIDIERLNPQHRATFSAGYNFGDFALMARENFYSSFKNQQQFPGQTFGSEFTTDIEASYTFDERFTLAVGATNVFNNYPDKIEASAQNPIYVLTNSLSNGLVYPSSGGPFGINGGFWYARVGVKF